MSYGQRCLYPENAVILAAGLGIRLQNLTNNAPKCLVEVNGKSILERQLECLDNNGIRNTTIVVGYKREKIIDKIGSRFGNMEVRYIVNEAYEKTNNIYSLWLAREILLSGCVLLEADIFFEDAVIRRICESVNGDIAVLAKYRDFMDGTMVELNGDGTLKDMYLKRDQSEDFPCRNMYKTVNIYAISKTFAWEFFVPMLDEKIEKGIVNEYYELVLKEIVKAGRAGLHGLLIDDLKWYEIDTMADLNAAREIFS